MSSIIRFSESSPKNERLVLSNQGMDCFLELLLCAAADFEQTGHRKELISFLEDRKELNDAAPGTADFDIVELPWKEESLSEDVRFLLQIIQAAGTEPVLSRLPYEINREIVLPRLEQFGSMIERMMPEKGGSSPV